MKYAVHCPAFSANTPSTLVCLQEAVEYVKVLMKVLNAVSDKRAVQYALTVIERCVYGAYSLRHRIFCPAYQKASSLAAIMNPTSPNDDTVQGIHAFRENPVDHGSRMHTSPVVKALKRAEAEGDLYSVECAATAAARLVAADSSDTPAAGELLSWAQASISSFHDVEAGTDAARAAEAAVSALIIMLRHATVREYFVSDSSSLQHLLPLLNSKDTQLVYEVRAPFPPACGSAVAAHGLCCTDCQLSVETHLQREWTALHFGCGWYSCLVRHNSLGLTRQDCAHGRFMSRREFAPPLQLPAHLPAHTNFFLQSIAQHFHDDNVGHELPEPMPLIGESRVPDVLQSLLREAAKAEKFKDPELLEAVDYLLQCISFSRRSMTSLARYKAQLSTGVLRPGALHSPEFWQENVQAFEADQWALVKQLKALLDNPGSSSETLTLALNDLAEFAVYHPNGRTVLVGLHVKDSAMALVRSEQQDVKHAALLTLSRLMLARWDFVDGGRVSAGK